MTCRSCLLLVTGHEEQMPIEFYALDYEIHDLREPHHSLPLQGGMGVVGYEPRSRMFDTPCNNDRSNIATAATASSFEVGAYAWTKTASLLIGLEGSRPSMAINVFVLIFAICDHY
eukprot:Gb_25881 [translate_table: standard]